MKIYFAHSKELKNYAEIYEKLGNLNEHKFILPYKDTPAAMNSKEYIKSVDFVFAEVSLPSTGVGIELGWAESFGIPIICAYKTGLKPSGSLKYVTNKLFEYSNVNDLIGLINNGLNKDN